MVEKTYARMKSGSAEPCVLAGLINILSSSPESCGFDKQSRLRQLCLAFFVVIRFVNVTGHDAADGIRAILAQKRFHTATWDFLAQIARLVLIPHNILAISSMVPIKSLVCSDR